jgi:putative DNA primase/helicase
VGLLAKSEPVAHPTPEIDAAAVPAELKARDQWVVWRKVVRKGKSTKVPFRSLVPHAEASTTDESTWSTFDEAMDAASDGSNRLHGIGFVFSPEDGLAGIDLDNCLDEEGTMQPWARSILDRVPGYAEVSPSGRGVKLFVASEVPHGKGRKVSKLGDGSGAVEVYDRGRYFTVTGRVFTASHRAIVDASGHLAALHAELFPPKSEPRRVSPAVAGRFEDAELVARASRASRGGDNFARLWAGSTDGYPSKSEADLALASALAFWTGGDPEAVDRLFRLSGLYSEKWDRESYREPTIQKAVDRRTFFDPNKQAPLGPARPVGDGTPRQPGDMEADHADDEGCSRRTDLGNALRLVRLAGDEVRYCFPWGKWLGWAGDRWQPDETGIIYRHARRVVAELHREAKDEADEASRKAKVAWAMACESEKRINAMASMARHEPGIPVLPDQLDADPWLLNCPNGTVDLRSCRLGPHVRPDLITRRAGVPFRPDAPCPAWEAFLSWAMAGDPDMVGFLRRAVGYSLSGDVGEHALFFLYGRGRNGKSTFLNAVLHALGDYAITINADVLTAKNQDEHPTGVADLQGRRFVATIEVEDGKRMAESLVKTLTGGDTIRARRMRQDFYEFPPTHKLWMAANHKPTVKGTDDGIWRRIKLIPFAAQVDPSRIDRSLPARLKAEAPGILAWAVRGLGEWLTGGLREPPAVLEATAEYREEMDLMADFLGDRCLVADSARVAAGPLYQAYVDWCKRTGGHPATMNKFGRLMTERGFPIDKKNSRNTRLGIGLKDDPNAAEPPEQPF